MYKFLDWKFSLRQQSYVLVPLFYIDVFFFYQFHDLFLLFGLCTQNETEKIHWNG